MKKNVLLITALMAAVIFSTAACNKNKAQGDAQSGEAPTWRGEFIYYGMEYDMGAWRSGNNRLTFTTEVVKGCVILYAGNDSESSTFRLISKKDQPAGKESSFTIEDNTGTYTVKYTLPADDLKFFTITDTGGLKPDFMRTGTYIHSFWGHDPGPETFTGYLKEVEAALEKARAGKAPKAQIQELENAVTVIQNTFFSERQDIVIQDTAPAPELYYATSNVRLRSQPDTSQDNSIANISQGGSVELLKVGKTETIDGITAPR